MNIGRGSTDRAQRGPCKNLFLVDFAARGDAYLDEVFTNRSDLFAKSIPYFVSIKTDHTAVILPAGTKLKPIRQNVCIRDCRKHRKEGLYLKLVSENWDSVLNSNDVEEAVNNLEAKIKHHMDECMPLRSVRMSSRDPVWMTPLVKSLMRVKSRIAPSNKDRLAEINRKISELISKNRRTLAKAPVGSREWWKYVHNLSQRRSISANAYTKPVPAIEDKSLEAPQISERHVCNCLQHLKKTAMGPDLIPFWVWRDHAEIFTSVIHKIWNVSLKTSKWPSSWKRAHVTPLPKIYIPNGKQDFRGIKITPVIARAFEKSVYNTHARDIVEQHLSSTQFAYTTGGSCTDALLSMQHTIYRYLDEQDYKAVRVFAMGFSKAFDCVNHELLSSKLRQLPLNPLIVNWYLSFLEKRRAASSL